MFPLGQVPNRVNRENVPVMRLESSITAGHFPCKDTCQKYSVNHGYTCKRAGLHWTREFIFPYKCKIAGLQHISGSSYFTAWLQCSWRLYASEIRYHTQGLEYLCILLCTTFNKRNKRAHTHKHTHTEPSPEPTNFCFQAYLINMSNSSKDLCRLPNQTRKTLTNFFQLRKKSS